MKVKIDTRDKFHVITFQESVIAANMSEQMDKVLVPLLDGHVKNVIVSLKDIKNMDNAAACHLLDIQHRFYEVEASMVVCDIQSSLKAELLKDDLLTHLNFAPTESEAIDIIHMEEIERE